MLAKLTSHIESPKVVESLVVSQELVHPTPRSPRPTVNMFYAKPPQNKQLSAKPPQNNEDGIINLEGQIRAMEGNGEVPAEELESMRNRLAERRDQFAQAKWCVHALTEPMRDLNVQHAQGNNEI